MTKQSESAVTGHHFSPQLHQSTAPFSHFVQHGDTGYTAGIIGQDRRTGALVSEDVAEQCAAMLTNLETLLQEVGLAQLLIRGAKWTHGALYPTKGPLSPLTVTGVAAFRRSGVDLRQFVRDCERQVLAYRYW